MRVKFLVPTPAGEETRQTLENALLATSPFVAGLNSDERRTLRTLVVKISEGGTTEAGKSSKAEAT